MIILGILHHVPQLCSPPSLPMLLLLPSHLYAPKTTNKQTKNQVQG